MKPIKIILIAFIMITGSVRVNAQNDTVRIQTSSQCEQCKERIESDLSFEKGVKSSNLDLKTNIVTVVYNPKKTDAQKIREAITRVGYDADTLKANEKSYRKLPDCCKRDGMKHN